MPQSIAEGPFIWLYLFLLTVVFFRAQATYWLGRYAGHLSARYAHRRNLTARPSVSRAIAALRERGWVVIPLSFLTIGFQTACNLGAGLIGIRPLIYTAAMIPGCLAWAGIYATVGFAVWQAALASIAGSPAGTIALVALTIGVGAYIFLRRRARTATNVKEHRV
ncbi:MAG: hypothetical protein Q4P33_03780 [Flaviflexus sp.]|nr:hypothetical protein [Flaviflexus sp.]